MPAEASATTGTPPAFQMAPAATSRSQLGGTSNETRSPGARPASWSERAATDERASRSAQDRVPSGPS